MSQEWLIFLGCALVAAMFTLWPLWRYKSSRFFGHTKSSDLVQIFRENLYDLESQQERTQMSAEVFASLKSELERNLLRDYKSLSRDESSRGQKNLWRFAIIFSAVMIGSALFVYDRFGSLQDVRIQQLQKEKLQLDYEDMIQNRQPNQERNRALANAYQERLLERPDNIQYMFLLARLRLTLEQYGEAVDLYKKIMEKDSESSLIMAELAQAMYLRDGKQLIPKGVELAQRALLLDAKNTTALGLLGLHAYNQQDTKGAINYWRKIIALVAAESPVAKYWQQAIVQVKENYLQAGGKSEDLESRSAYTLQLHVSLSPKLQVPADTVVFIYARAWQGSPMPLAISRVKAADLPQDVFLDETMAMSPAASLATAEQVEVVARISKDGSAQAKPGDWQASMGPIDMKAITNPISLEITQQLPANP